VPGKKISGAVVVGSVVTPVGEGAGLGVGGGDCVGLAAGGGAVGWTAGAAGETQETRKRMPITSRAVIRIDRMGCSLIPIIIRVISP